MGFGGVVCWGFLGGVLLFLLGFLFCFCFFIAFTVLAVIEKITRHRGR